MCARTASLTAVTGASFLGLGGSVLVCVPVAVGWCVVAGGGVGDGFLVGGEGGVGDAEGAADLGGVEGAVVDEPVDGHFRGSQHVGDFGDGPVLGVGGLYVNVFRWVAGAWPGLGVVAGWRAGYR